MMGQGKVTVNGEIALVALGSNATSSSGGPQNTVEAAISALFDAFVNVKVSGLYQTPAFPAGNGADFVNAACKFECDLGARALLDNLHAIEATFGRERDVRWGPRTLDLDLIAYGDTILPDDETYHHWQRLSLADQQTRTPDQLILPHPRLADRAFVLIPLADVAPGWTHPVTGLSVQSMCDGLDSAARAEITPL